MGYLLDAAFAEPLFAQVGGEGEPDVDIREPFADKAVRRGATFTQFNRGLRARVP